MNGVPPSASTSEPPHWQQLDIDALDSVLYDRQGVKSVLQLNGEDAVAIVEVLNRALHSVNLDAGPRKMYAFLLGKLCGRCGILPKSYIIADGLEVVSHQPCAAGGFGDVWEGRCNDIPVAIKSLRACSSDNILRANKRFCKEVIIWKHLRHPNVLPFLGVSNTPSPSSMVSAWMPHGNIVEYVKANPQANRLALLSDVASGLHYLHSMDLVHGDLKGANILINQDFRACLADFGLMRIVSDPRDQYSAITTEISKGTVRWMAPELLRQDASDINPSKKCDMYAMAMVILEVMTGNVPFRRYGNLKVILSVVAGVRPERPTAAGMSDGLWRIVQLCWHQQSDERPAIGLVLDHLTEAARYWDPPSSKVADSGLDINENSDTSDAYPDSPTSAEFQLIWRLPTQDDTSAIIKYSSPDDVLEDTTNGLRTTAQDNSVNLPFAPQTPAQSLDAFQHPLADSPGASLDSKLPGNKSERSFWSSRGARTTRSQDSIEGTGNQETSAGVMDYIHRAFLRPRNEKRASSLTERGTTLVDLFKRTQKFEDLEEAIMHYREALDLRPPGNPNRLSSLNNLAGVVHDRFRRVRRPEDLEETIVYYREALDLCPSGNPDRSISLNKLAVVIHDRFKRTHRLDDLQEAIVYNREALELCSPENPDRSSPLVNLAIFIHDRFKWTHKLEDLEEALAYHRQALDLHPPGNPNRSNQLRNLAAVVHDRFKQTHKVVDLDEAIIYLREVLVLCPPGNPTRPSSLYNLAFVIYDRFKWTRKSEDLKEALVYHRQALDLHPPGDPNRSDLLYNLAVVIYNQFKLTHKVVDLDEVIVYLREVLVLCPPGNPNRPSSLNNLAIVIHDRFRRTHKLEDLVEAIAYHRQALDLCPSGSPDRSRSLNILALAIKDCFRQTGKIEDLEEAIAYNREALDLRPPGNPDRSTSLNNLAVDIHDRFKRTRRAEDLEEAITCYREALELRPPGNPDRSKSLHNFAVAIHDRFKQNHKLEDLKEAIANYHQALELLPPGNPDRSRSLKHLSIAIRHRVERTQQLQDWHRAADRLSDSTATVVPH